MTNWESIVATHGRVVWCTLWRLLDDRGDVEECFQETFIAAVKLSRREVVESWPAVLGNLAAATSSEASPEQRAVAAELSERLREALTQLPERQAELFYLHVLCGQSYQELAERMQVAEGAVRVNIHRARQRLRELLAE